MNPILTAEFSARIGDSEITEESVALHSPEELFAFVAPGGGCEAIPDAVAEIRMMFLPPAHPNTGNPVADAPATLQLGIVLITGPLAELVQTAEALIDKSGRGELSDSFRRVLHLEA